MTEKTALKLVRKALHDNLLRINTDEVLDSDSDSNEEFINQSDDNDQKKENLTTFVIYNYLLLYQLHELNESYDRYFKILDEVSKSIPTINMNNIKENYKKYRHNSRRILIEMHLHQNIEKAWRIKKEFVIQFYLYPEISQLEQAHDRQHYYKDKNLEGGKWKKVKCNLESLQSSNQDDLKKLENTPFRNVISDISDIMKKNKKLTTL